MSACVFCEIIAKRSPAEYVAQWAEAIAIVPVGPVVAGHVIVIPRVHVRDFSTEPMVTAMTMARAAELVRDLGGTPANLITSAGKAATQSVLHLHVHVVPRAENDGLALPWHAGRTRATTEGKD